MYKQALSISWYVPTAGIPCKKLPPPFDEPRMPVGQSPSECRSLLNGDVPDCMTRRQYEKLQSVRKILLDAGCTLDKFWATYVRVKNELYDYRDVNGWCRRGTILIEAVVAMGSSLRSSLQTGISCTEDSGV